MVRFEKHLDAPLIEYAESHDFARIEGDIAGGVLFVAEPK